MTSAVLAMTAPPARAQERPPVLEVPAETIVTEIAEGPRNGVGGMADDRAAGASSRGSADPGADAGGGDVADDESADPGRHTAARQGPPAWLLSRVTYQSIISGPVLEHSTGRVFVIADGRLRAFDANGTEVASVPSPVGFASIEVNGGLFLRGIGVTREVDPTTLEVLGSYSDEGVPLGVGDEVWFAQRLSWAVVDRTTGARRTIADPLVGQGSPLQGPVLAWHVPALGSRILHPTDGGLRVVDVSSGEPVTDAVLAGVRLVHLGSDGSVFTLEADDTTLQRDASLEPVGPIGPGASFSAFAADSQLVFGLPPGAAFGDAPSVWRPGQTEPVLTLPDGTWSTNSPVLVPDGSGLFSSLGSTLTVRSLAPTVEAASSAVFRPQWTPEIALSGDSFVGVTEVRVNGRAVPHRQQSDDELHITLRDVAPAPEGVVEVIGPLGRRPFVIPGTVPRGSAVVAVWTAALDGSTHSVNWRLRCDNDARGGSPDFSMNGRQRPGVVDLVLVPTLHDCTVTFPDDPRSPTRVALYDPDDLVTMVDIWEDSAEFVSGRAVLVGGFARDPDPPRPLWLFADAVGGAPDDARYRVRVSCGTWRTTVSIRGGFGVRVEIPTDMVLSRRCRIVPVKGRGVQSVRSVAVGEGRPQVGDQRGRISGTIGEIDDLRYVVHRFDHGGADRSAAIVIGNPGESIGRARNAGSLHVVATRADGRPVLDTDSLLRRGKGLPGRPRGGDAVGSAVVVGDFDRDGFDDLAVGAPGQRVRRRSEAGVVTISYGGPGGSVSRRQTIDRGRLVGAGPMARGDRFGAALAVVDFDGDGYDDLAIGAPGARVGKVRAAGVVVVVPGSERGLVDRVDSTWSQRRTAGERAERGDGFGSVLAANRGVLAIGVPMESAGRRRAAGVVHRIEGPTLAVHTFRRSTPKAGDLFGAAVDVDLHGKVVVGAPGVDIGGNRDAGLIALYELTRPSVAIRTVDAGDVLLGAALRAGNRFGSVVRFVGTPGAEEVFVGAPGATVAGRRGAGVVHFVDVDDVTPEQGWIRADIAGMPVGPVAGAGLGSSLSIGRRGQVVIGVPGLGPRGSGSVLIAAGPGSWQLLDQDTRGIADRAEAGDTFGATLAG